MDEPTQTATLYGAIIAAAGFATVLIRKWPSEKTRIETAKKVLEENRKSQEEFHEAVRKEIRDLRGDLRNLEENIGMNKELVQRHAARLTRIESKLDNQENMVEDLASIVDRGHWTDRLTRLEKIFRERELMGD